MVPKSLIKCYIQRLKQVTIRDVILESDSKIVVDTLLDLCNPPMVVLNILDGVAHKLYDFRSAQVSYVKRQGNKPTHLLAQHAKKIDNINNYATWIEENSLLIVSVITHDVMNLSSS